MSDSSVLYPVRRVASPVREQTAEAIRIQIMSGGLREGQRLVERELCEQLDVSRNTLREAYRQLEAEGFIDIRPHKGPTVARITPSDATSLYEMREALEGMAIKVFTLRASDADLAELVESFEQLRTAHTQSDTNAVLQSKEAFYDVLYRGAANKVLESHARVLRGRLAQLRVRSLSRGSRREQMLLEIDAVLEHIKKRDAERAQSAWCEHIRLAARAAEESLAAAASEAEDRTPDPGEDHHQPTNSSPSAR
ncbi:GntR family transcriptional regulator [Microbacterium pseudoresistens]|uniref:DNA-binding GntR family transcriptional regulator n=1 Tax=Microbacterium pseudoresistens TaxID=640634 RepID=A0A7Y9EU36_9MICO|nr:DNA-binding GntR family transcriptional regulator [Microbacterium pseudoresistens]